MRILLEFLICCLVAAFLMIVHEFTKALLYRIINRKINPNAVYKRSVFKFGSYVDPVGIIFALTCNAPFSRPYMFRIREKKVNRILGFAGFAVIALCFVISTCILKFHVFGAGVVYHYDSSVMGWMVSITLQYMALLSFGMFCINLFPVSVFDMGLIIAGYSSKYYLSIIKMDAHIKFLMFITVALQLIEFAGYKLLGVLL